MLFLSRIQGEDGSVLTTLTIRKVFDLLCWETELYKTILPADQSSDDVLPHAMLKRA